MSDSSLHLSIAMIVRDEEEELPACVDNIKQFADEICIVDTGSQDNTLKIAESMGAKIKQCEWSNDFSTARNESLKLCSGSWIFVLDADERISADDGEKLRHLAKTEPTYAYRIWTKNYTHKIHRSDFLYAKKDDTWRQEFPGYFPSAKIRLFPNYKDIKFEGPVHETVLSSLNRLGITIVDEPNIVVHHYGERKPLERVIAKQKLYLLLGEKKIQEQTDNPLAYAELASQYAEMGMFLKALEYYRKALENDANNEEWWGEIASILLILGKDKEAEQAFSIAIKLNKNYFPAWRNLGLLHIKSKQWDKALDALYQANRIRPDESEILESIGVILLEKGEKEKAREYFLLLSNKEPENVRAKSYLNLYE